MSTLKKYRLKKDLPDCAAGSLFIHDGGDCYNYESTQYSDGKSWYKESVIETTPEWFELVKEDRIEDDSFKWTDELVLVVADLAHHYGYHKFTDKRVVDLFDEVKKQAMGSGYKYSKWITDHLSQKSTEQKEVLFTQQQMDKAVEDAFFAARIVKGVPLALVKDHVLTKEQVQQIGLLHISVQDYLKYKQQSSQ